MNKNECMEFFLEQCGDRSASACSPSDREQDTANVCSPCGPDLCQEFMGFLAGKQAVADSTADCGKCAEHCPCCS